MNLGNKKSNLLILLAVFILGGCGNFSGNYEEIESSASSESTTTTTTFTVSSVSPTDGQTSVSRTPDIIITFSDDVYGKYSAWTNTSATLASCSGSSFNWKVVHVSSDNFSQCIRDNGTVSGKTITLNLNGILDASTTYKIKIMKTSSDGTWTTQSTSGTQLSSDYTFSFTTQ